MDTVLLALRVLLSLAAVLALLWLLRRRVGKRMRSRAVTGGITVVNRQGLGRRASVVMVEVDGTRLLLGVTEQQVSVLHSVVVPAAAGADADAMEAALLEPDFARSLREASADVPLLRPRRDRTPQSKLSGSLLSAATWKQTGATLRQTR